MKLIDEKFARIKAAQKNGSYTLCPRCGRKTMKPDLYTNALSRIADIMVCDECGVDEAKLAFMQSPGTLYTWAALRPEKPKSDFKTLSGEEAWKRICDEQAELIWKLRERHLNGDDPQEIRLAAFESCPGLTEIWTQPFVLHYTTRDGTLVVNFRKRKDGSAELTGSIVKGGGDR